MITYYVQKKLAASFQNLLDCLSKKVLETQVILFEFFTNAATVIPGPRKSITVGNLKYTAFTQVKCHINASDCPVWFVTFIM